MDDNKKRRDNNDKPTDEVINNRDGKREIMILVTDEDKTGRDVMCMSDFFSIAVQELSKELISAENLVEANSLPVFNISLVNEALQTVGVFCSPEFDLVPDFASLPKDIQERYKAGELILGESKEVSGNIRAVLVDAKSHIRVKDVTLKRIEQVKGTEDISRNMLTQMQLKQISDKLNYMISEQSYLIDFTRNQAMIRPFLDARDYILKAQSHSAQEEQQLYLVKASENLQSAINSVYVDINTIEGHLADEGKKKWFQRFNRNNMDKLISRLTSDAILVTKYVGMQIQVYHYIDDVSSAKNVLDVYHRSINRFFEPGIVDSEKTLAMFIHENVEYTNNNMDCWYHLEETMRPILESTYDMIQEKDIYVLKGDNDYE